LSEQPPDSIQQLGLFVGDWGHAWIFSGNSIPG
jgi:hypothetical protein